MDDLVSTVATDDVRVASTREAWQAFTSWVPLNFARQPGIWVLIAGAAVLAWVADSLIVTRLVPHASLWPVVGWACLIGAAAYLLATTTAALMTTRTRNWVLLIDTAGKAVIGARIRHDDRQSSIIVNNHFARHIGAGEGQQLRTALAPRLRAFMDSHPALTLRFTAQNERLARAYLDDIGTELQATDGWRHDLHGRKASIGRVR